VLNKAYVPLPAPLLHLAIANHPNQGLQIPHCERGYSLKGMAYSRAFVAARARTCIDFVVCASVCVFQKSDKERPYNTADSCVDS